MRSAWHHLPGRHLPVTFELHSGSMDTPDLLDSRTGSTIGFNSELSSGDRVEAYYKGTLVHRGEVTDIAPNLELFWIQDDLTGGRRLLDLAELDVHKTAAS